VKIKLFFKVNRKLRRMRSLSIDYDCSAEEPFINLALLNDIPLESGEQLDKNIAANMLDMSD